MIDELKNEQLTEEEMSGVVGGNSFDRVLASDDFLVNAEDKRMWSTFTKEEKELVRAQPDRASRRAKMIEICRQQV